MSLKVWIDGKLYDKADAKISVCPFSACSFSNTAMICRPVSASRFPVGSSAKRTFG